MSQDAAVGSVDMDRLNRNLPQDGRQTRQALQVSAELFVPVSSLDLFSQLNSWNLLILLLLENFHVFQDIPVVFPQKRLFLGGIFFLGSKLYLQKRVKCGFICYQTACFLRGFGNERSGLSWLADSETEKTRGRA